MVEIHRMGLNTEQRQKTDYFIGTEIEHTAMLGEKHCL